MYGDKGRLGDGGEGEGEGGRGGGGSGGMGGDGFGAKGEGSAERAPQSDADLRLGVDVAAAIHLLANLRWRARGE